MVVVIISYILVGLLLFYLYFKWVYTYWARRGVPYEQPELLFGNVRNQLLNDWTLGDQFAQFYRNAKAKGYKHVGIYRLWRPTYVPVDLEIIKHIFQKDFGYFVNHGMYVNEELDPLTGHLFNLEDDKWKKLRVKLTPTFTSGKMKMMFPTLVKCSEGLEIILNDHSILRDPVDIKDVVSRFTTDIIGSCAFGINCNSLKDPKSEFRYFGDRLFKLQFLEKIRIGLTFFLPLSLTKLLRIKQTPQDVEEFFINMVRGTVEYREKNNIHRKDFMHLLLQLKNRGEITDGEAISKDIKSEQNTESLSIEEIAAQCFVFFAAGYETSASTMTFALLELAMNNDVQERLRKDILSVLERHNEEITYEAIMEMAFLDKVVHETLRKHPPIPGIPRVCNKDYKIPDTDVTLEAGTRVHIPFQAIHRDPEYYPNPNKFDPERFNEENKATRPHYSFLPFGEGPRICIGARFAFMQVKVGLITIIKNFKVTLDKKTKLPITYEPRSFVTAIRGGVWLNVSKI